MIISPREYQVRGTHYTVRSAEIVDASQLSNLRYQIDGETENMDREQGEGFLSPSDFAALIQSDREESRNLFLVAEVNGQIVGYSRCEGTALRRFRHKVEFGVGVLQIFWGYGIGTHLLKESIAWADAVGIGKMTLYVMETNEKAIGLYRKLGFEVEGVLKYDKRLADGGYYNTLMMARVHHSLM